MDEQHTCVTQQPSTDMKEGTKSTNMDRVSSSNEDKQTEEEDYAGENKELEETPLKEESKAKNIKAGGDDGGGVVGALPPKDMDVLKKEDEKIKQQRNNVEILGPTLQEATESTVPGATGGLAEDHTRENKTHDRKDDKGDGHTVGLEEESPPDPKETNTETGGDNNKDTTQPPNMAPVSPFEDEQTKTALTVKQPEDNGRGEECDSEDMDMLKKEEEELKEHRNNAERFGRTPQEITESTVPEVTGILAGRMRYLIVVSIVVVVAILVQYFLQNESPPQTNDMRQIDIFLRELEKVKTQFPSQRAELWNRSRIHLQRHLKTERPTEPVSLILTAGLRAERTMKCLAHGLAFAFSSALNASVLHIDGVSQASQDSDQVKLNIDRKLQGAFEGDKPVAVIHRFEELPPGSTLIFYRYCDHENAAYKRIFLIFTVLLEEEEEIPAKIRLNAVEEMVDDHLQKKFLSHGHPVSFDRMDLDKYGGLWSRISHLILPVAAEERIEHEGVQGDINNDPCLKSKH